MDMTAGVTARLERAMDLTDIVSAAHYAFEFMLPLIEGQQDPDRSAVGTLAATGVPAPSRR